MHQICQNLNVTHKDEHFEEKKNPLELNETRDTQELVNAHLVFN